MSLVSKAQKIRTALTGITDLKVYHLTVPAGTKAPYAVWQEDSEGQSMHADDQKIEQVLEVTIDYFTKTEYDAMTDTIQGALNDARIAWRLNSFQYEEEAALLHYEWLCRVI